MAYNHALARTILAERLRTDNRTTINAVLFVPTARCGRIDGPKDVTQSRTTGHRTVLERFLGKSGNVRIVYLSTGSPCLNPAETCQNEDRTS